MHTHNCECYICSDEIPGESMGSCESFTQNPSVPKAPISSCLTFSPGLPSGYFFGSKHSVIFSDDLTGQGWPHRHATCAVTQGPVLRRTWCLAKCSAVTILHFFMIFK